MNDCNMTPEEIAIANQRLKEAIDRLIKGERDPQAMRKACEEMDAAREELQKRIGIVEVAVDLIRDAPRS
jgi:hypothetical protein